MNQIIQSQLLLAPDQGTKSRNVRLRVFFALRRIGGPVAQLVRADRS